jgi:hypothetical protein
MKKGQNDKQYKKHYTETLKFEQQEPKKEPDVNSMLRNYGYFLLH